MRSISNLPSKAHIMTNFAHYVKIPSTPMQCNPEAQNIPHTTMKLIAPATSTVNSMPDIARPDAAEGFRTAPG